MKNLDNTPDRIQMFSRVREKMSTELQSLLESVIPVIANDIDAIAQKGSLTLHEQRQLYAAAALLRMEKSSRVAQARAVFNERALRCLEVAARDAQGGNRTLSLLEEDELEVQILAADCANYVRQEQPQVCLGFAKRVEYLTNRHWSNDDLQPIGPRTLGAAAGAALRSLAMAPGAKREIKAILINRLKDSLTRLVVETDRDLVAQRVLPDWTPELDRNPELDTPAAVELPAQFEQMPIPAIWNVANPSDAKITPLPQESPYVQPQRPTPMTAAIAPLPQDPEQTHLDRPFPEVPALTESVEPAPVAAMADDVPYQVSVDTPAAVADAPSAQPFDPYADPNYAQIDADTIEIQAPREASIEHTTAITELAAQVSRKLDRSPFAATDSTAKLRVMPVLQPVLDIERDAVAFAHSIGAVPYSRESRRAFFHNVGERLRAASSNPAQVATVEVVGAMFDYVVDDRRLPEPAKPLFWRLQQPAVALALLDPGYLSNEPRSLRRLVENFGAIATAYSDEFVKGGELHRRLETVVRAVEIVSSALQVRSAVISQHVEREYGRAVRNVTRLVDRVVNERSTLESTPARQNRRDYRRRPDKQREIEVSEKLRLMLEDRLNKHQVPASAKEFILTVWLRHLRTAVLRDGEDSTEFKLALEVVDDLLWSMDTAKPAQSRRALAKRIPPLIRLLTSGLKEIGAREDEHKAFFDELFLVHLRKMRRDAGEGADDSTVLSDLTPLTSLPTLREELSAFETINLPTEPAPASETVASKNGAAAPSSKIGEPKTGNGKAAPEVPIFAPSDARDVLAKDAGAQRPAGSGNGEKAPAASPRLSRASAARQGDADDLSAGVLNQPSLAPNSESGGVGRVTAAPSAQMPANGVAHDDRAPEQRLLEVLHSLDLSDPPNRAVREDISVERLLATLGRGQWLTLLTRDGGESLAKIAWVNSRRTVVLLVRHPDRRALSMRMDELRSRAEQGRAFLVASNPA